MHRSEPAGVPNNDGRPPPLTPGAYSFGDQTPLGPSGMRRAGAGLWAGFARCRDPEFRETHPDLHAILLYFMFDVWSGGGLAALGRAVDGGHLET